MRLVPPLVLVATAAVVTAVVACQPRSPEEPQDVTTNEARGRAGNASNAGNANKGAPGVSAPSPGSAASSSPGSVASPSTDSADSATSPSVDPNEPPSAGALESPASNAPRGRPLSVAQCESLWNKAVRAIESFDDSHQACAKDEDCTVVRAGVCLSACDTSVAKAAAPEREVVMQRARANECAAWNAGGCPTTAPKPVPSCPMYEAKCIGGRCNARIKQF